MSDAALNVDHSSVRDQDAASPHGPPPEPAPAPAAASTGKRNYTRKENLKSLARKRPRGINGRFERPEPVPSESDDDDAVSHCNRTTTINEATDVPDLHSPLVGLDLTGAAPTCAPTVNPPFPYAHVHPPLAPPATTPPLVPFASLLAPPPNDCARPHIDPTSLAQLLDMSQIVASLSPHKWEWMVEKLLLAHSLDKAASTVRLLLNDASIRSSSALAVLGLAFLRMANDTDQPDYGADSKFSCFMDILRIPYFQPPPPPPTPAPNPRPPFSFGPPATPLVPSPSTSRPLATSKHTSSASSTKPRAPSVHSVSASSAPSGDDASSITLDTPTSSRPPSKRRDTSNKKSTRKRDTTSEAILSVTEDKVKSLAVRRKHHPRVLDQLLALRWQAQLVSTGMTQLAASAVVSRVHFGRDAKDSTRAARKTNKSWRTFETTGSVEASCSHRPRKARAVKDPIYSRDFVERAKEKMIELTASKQNPGQVWRKL